jgi:hypothetical protein
VALVEDVSLLEGFDFLLLCRFGQLGSVHFLNFLPCISTIWYSPEPQPDEDAAVCNSDVTVDVRDAPLELFAESALASVTCVRLEYPESLERSGMDRC